MAVLKAEHIGAVYTREGESFSPFSDISFSLEAGKIYDLIGSSGSGKSTLLRICALMLDRSFGKLYLDEKESSQFLATTWRKNVSLVPQLSALVPGTVKTNLLLPWRFKVRSTENKPSDTILLELLAKAGLDDIGLNRDVSQLSGGQVARVALLRVFVTKPRVLLLDEVDASLDDESAYAIGRLTKELVGNEIACLRIRHSSADGFADASFTLNKGVLDYQAKLEEWAYK